jgi:predicted RNA binding protein YcfA (HicA-like mRNA interferase family)
LNEWAEKRFEQAGLKFHQGKPKGEYPLNDLIRLLVELGFTIQEQQGSHIPVYHPGLEGWDEAPHGRITLVRKHPGSKNKPMTRADYVRVAWRAVVYLKLNGKLEDESKNN